MSEKNNMIVVFSIFKKFYDLEQEQRSYGDALYLSSLSLESEQQKAREQQLLADQQLGFQKLISIIVSVALVILVAGVIFILNRLRFIRKQNREIEAQKQRAERSEKHKEQFLANMSHEIRTPIHAISGMLKILRRNRHPDFQDKFLDAMTKSTDNLSKLLNDVLDLSKIESGKLTIANEPFAVEESVTQTIMLLEDRAVEKGLKIVPSISHEVPNRIVGGSTEVVTDFNQPD